MALYRVLKALSLQDRRVEAGQLISLTMSADKIDKLVAVGAISPLASPPLAEIPGWEGRAQLLPAIATVEQFLETPDDALAKVLQIAPGDVPRLKRSLEEVLFLPTTPPCGCW
jgi:hypothetical protein